jgi:hypothetical protein
MSVATNYKTPAGVQHLADFPLQTIEFAIKELKSLGVSQSEITARGALMTNDSALVTAIAAAVANRNS